MTAYNIYPTGNVIDNAESDTKLLRTVFEGGTFSASNANGDIPTGAFAGVVNGDEVIMWHQKETSPGSKTLDGSDQNWVIGDTIVDAVSTKLTLGRNGTPILAAGQFLSLYDVLGVWGEDVSQRTQAIFVNKKIMVRGGSLTAGVPDTIIVPNNKYAYYAGNDPTVTDPGTSQPYTHADWWANADLAGPWNFVDGDTGGTKTDICEWYSFGEGVATKDLMFSQFAHSGVFNEWHPGLVDNVVFHHCGWYSYAAFGDQRVIYPHWTPTNPDFSEPNLGVNQNGSWDDCGQAWHTFGSGWTIKDSPKVECKAQVFAELAVSDDEIDIIEPLYLDARDITFENNAATHSRIDGMSCHTFFGGGAKNIRFINNTLNGILLVGESAAFNAFVPFPTPPDQGMEDFELTGNTVTDFGNGVYFGDIGRHLTGGNTWVHTAPAKRLRPEYFVIGAYDGVYAGDDFTDSESPGVNSALEDWGATHFFAWTAYLQVHQTGSFPSGNSPANAQNHIVNVEGWNNRIVGFPVGQDSTIERPAGVAASARAMATLKKERFSKENPLIPASRTRRF